MPSRNGSQARRAKLFDCLPDERIVATLSQQLSWSHFVELIKIDDPTRRAFYTELCVQSRRPVRALREHRDGLLFERRAIAKQPEAVIRQELAQLGGASAIPALFLKDPYLLDFLDLKDGFTEKDLEAAILAEPAEDTSLARVMMLMRNLAGDRFVPLKCWARIVNGPRTLRLRR